MAVLSHNEINLSRLVRRLEKSAEDSNGAAPTANDQDTWITAQSTLQKVRHARKLLRDVELQYSAEAEVSANKVLYFEKTREKLENIQSTFDRISEDSQPELAPKLEPILSRLSRPKPEPEQESISLEKDSIPPPPESALLPSEGSWADTLPPPPSTATLLPSRFEGSDGASSSSTALPERPTFLQNSQQIQQELTDQLANMATQLKRNAHHFGQALDDDKAVMQGTEEKLESNFGVMTKEGGRLKTYSGQSSRTMWMTFLIVLFVFFVFMFMVALIRLTRW